LAELQPQIPPGELTALTTPNSCFSGIYSKGKYEIKGDRKRRDGRGVRWIASPF